MTDPNNAELTPQMPTEESDIEEDDYGLSVSMFLWAKPGWDLDEGSEADADKIRNCGKGIMEHTAEVASAVEKLKSDGWSATIALYDIYFDHPDVRIVEEAKARLSDLNLDPENFNIHDDY